MASIDPPFDDDEPYPRARALLARLLGDVSRKVGPSILRRPAAPVQQKARPTRNDVVETVEAAEHDDLLGELLDMVLVGGDGEGRHEVHMTFRAEVFSGLQVVLKSEADGLVARFVVEDSASRRAVAAHVDDLVAHLRARNIRVVRHELVLG
jgi:4-hydroxyphenylpyruvate dioxygenase-like putative hemolysin